jgi:hypothetical protein
MWKEAAVAYLKVLSQQLSQGTEKDYENPSHDFQHPRINCNPKS